ERSGQHRQERQQHRAALGLVGLRGVGERDLLDLGPVGVEEVPEGRVVLGLGGAGVPGGGEHQDGLPLDAGQSLEERARGRVVGEAAGPREVDGGAAADLELREFCVAGRDVVDVRGVHGSRVAQMPSGSPRASGSDSDDGASLRPSGRVWLVTRQSNTCRSSARTPGAPASTQEAPMADNDFTPAQNASTDGEFVRDATYINDRMAKDLEPGSDPVGEELGEMRWPVEAGRSPPMAARACPWARRPLIGRPAMGLEDAIPLGLAGPTHDVNSWVFDLDPDEKDPVTGLHRLQTAYFNRIPDYPRGITVPALVDLPTTSVVTNAYQKLNFDLLTEWTDFHRDGAPDLYPEAHRDEIDELDSWIYPTVNNGVYRCGFAAEQGPYEQAYDELWASLDCLEERLSTRRYLVGETITAAD